MMRLILVMTLVLSAGLGFSRTIHRSFRPREAGLGGGFGVVVPVDRRVEKAIAEGRTPEKDHAKLFSGEKMKPSRTNAVEVVRQVKVGPPPRKPVEPKAPKEKKR